MASANTTISSPVGITVHKSTRYKINNVGVPSPNDASFQDIVISRSWDDINGVFQDHLIRIRKQINWVYRALSKDLLNDFYNKMIMSKIISSKSRFFNITTDFPGYDSLTLNCYLGTPVEFKTVYSNKTGIKYYEFTLTWTEVEGTDLRWF